MHPNIYKFQYFGICRLHIYEEGIQYLQLHLLICICRIFCTCFFADAGGLARLAAHIFTRKDSNAIFSPMQTCNHSPLNKYQTDIEQILNKYWTGIEKILKKYWTSIEKILNKYLRGGLECTFLFHTNLQSLTTVTNSKQILNKYWTNIQYKFMRKDWNAIFSS